MVNPNEVNKNSEFFDIIPERLRKPEFRFMPLIGKRPFLGNWQTTGNYAYDDPVLLGYLRRGYNYGVCGGHGGLVILDFDDKEIRRKMLAKLPLTFQVMTGSGGSHHYYLTDNPESFTVDYQGHRAIDIQGKGKQVVGAGSLHPNGKRYKLALDTEIAHLSQAELLKIIKETLPEECWPSKLKPHHTEGKLPDAGSGHVDREELIRILTPYWQKDTGKHNNFSLAIAGLIRRAGGTLQDAEYVLTKLAEITGIGYGFDKKARYVFNLQDGSAFYGLSKLKEIMEAIANGQ